MWIQLFFRENLFCNFVALKVLLFIFMGVSWICFFICWGFSEILSFWVAWSECFVSNLSALQLKFLDQMTQKFLLQPNNSQIPSTPNLNLIKIFQKTPKQQFYLIHLKALYLSALGALLSMLDYLCTLIIIFLSPLNDLISTLLFYFMNECFCFFRTMTAL